MEQVIEAIGKWQYLQELAPQVSGFHLEMLRVQDSLLYRIFRYVDFPRHRSLEVLYDDATQDYLVRITVGLTEYCDVDYIFTALEDLEQALRSSLERTLRMLGTFCPESLCSVFRGKKILEWRYQRFLPKTLAGFELFIQPDEAVKVLNGSYIIIDYSDFHSDSNLIIYYNIFRDEFFGELRIHRTPQMARVFETKELSGLEEKLEQNLAATLQKMRSEIDQAPQS